MDHPHPVRRSKCYGFICVTLRAAILLGLLAASPGVCSAQAARDLDPARNLALKKPVTFLPAPQYAATAAGGTDAIDLTDGRICPRPDQRIWFEKSSVGWAYAGRVNFAIDLGRVEPIDEVAIRLLGGTMQNGNVMPPWVEVFTSDGPGQPWYREGEFSHWNPDDLRRYGVPKTEEGKAWVHRLRFQGLKTRGRLVGFRLYGSSTAVSDEIYVFKGAHDPQAVRRDPAALSDFTVSEAALYLNKPYVPVSPDLVAPLPLGLLCAQKKKSQPMTITLKTPAGVEIVGGNIGPAAIDDAKVTRDASGSTWKLDFSTRGLSDKVAGKLWVRGAPAGAAMLELEYQLSWGDYHAPAMRYPIKVVSFPPAAAPPKRLTTSLGWFRLERTQSWPGWKEAYARIGLNTINAFITWFNPADQSVIDFAAAARQAGYKIQSIDNTWDKMVVREGKRNPEVLCQFSDGGHGKRLCPSYRGKFYQQELQRVATGVRLLQPSHLDCDVELWTWTGPKDAEKCTRCQADKQASGIASWDEWRLARGEQMWRELWATVQAAVKESGGPPCEMGMYDARPGSNYQFFWPFDRLYPKYMQLSEVSTYTYFGPYDIALTGNEVRKDRLALPTHGPDIYPWVSPGDCGTFADENFYLGLLECYFNGARGIGFWSDRMLDAELLAAYARAIRVAAQVEDIIMDGAVYVPKLEGGGRISGMKHGDEAALLVSDLAGESGGTVRVKLTLERASQVTDLVTGEKLATLQAGSQILPVKLDGARARAIVLRPMRRGVAYSASSAR